MDSTRPATVSFVLPGTKAWTDAAGNGSPIDKMHPDSGVDRDKDKTV